MQITSKKFTFYAVCLHRLCGKCHLMKACHHNLKLFRKFSWREKFGQLSSSFWSSCFHACCIFFFELWFCFLLDFPRVGISLPTVEVRFEHLNVETEAYVGSRALPTFTNYCVNIIEGPTCKHELLVFVKLVMLILLISLLNFYQCSYGFEGFVELSEYSRK